MTEWKQVKAIRGFSSGSLFLPPAILFSLIGLYYCVNASNHGKAADWIMFAICMVFCYVFICVWLDCRRNRCVMFYNDEVMIFQEKPSGSFGTRFKSLRMIDQDRRGYTLILDLGDRFRLLHRHMQPDLQHILDAHQHRLKCENLVNNATSATA